VGIVWTVASRYLRSKRRLSFISLISLLATGGVFVGVSALVIVLSVMNGFEDQVQRRIAGTNAHIAVLSADDRPVAVTDSLVAGIRSAAPEAEWAPFVYAKAMIVSRHSIDGLVLKGVDPVRERGVTDIMDRLKPSAAPLDGGDLPGLGLGQELALRLRVVPGDIVLISLPSEEPGGVLGAVPRVKRVRVSSIFRSGLYEYDSSFGIVRLSTAQDFFGLGSKVTGVELSIPDMFHARETARGIQAAVGGDYRVTNWIDLNQNLFSWMAIEKAVMFTILVLIVLVAAVNIVSSLIMLVLEKRRDIGVLRTMGVTPRGILRIFLVQGTLVGSIGTSLGITAGFVVSYVLGRYKLLHLPGEIYFIDTLPVKIEWTDLLFVALAATITCFVASLYPAWKAARLAPVDAIRYE
jgi:lipoprotein-releasing system permease protein